MNSGPLREMADDVGLLGFPVTGFMQNSSEKLICRTCYSVASKAIATADLATRRCGPPVFRDNVGYC